jgi:soluble lytic murein transglycosylase-like protein
LDLRDLFARFSKAVLLPGFVVIGLFTAVPVSAQESAPASGPAKDVKAELKSSLNDLSSIYQKEVDRLAKQQEQSKSLYNDGLISRVEFEKGEKALADARAKVEQVAKEIAAANQPVPELAILSDSTASAAAVWSTGNPKIDNLIRYYGKQYGVDPFLIYCTMSQESGFTTGATSPKGAMGLMQLMPGTAARYGVTNPYDVGQSIMGGTRYLKDLLKMFNGRVDLALAGYNAGEGAVMKYGNSIPPYEETRNYVKLILKRYTRKPTS